MVIVSVACRKCSGTGELILYESDGTERFSTCPLCEDGLIYTEKTCSRCKGTGKTP